MSPYPTRQVVQSSAERILQGELDVVAAIDAARRRGEADGACGLLLAAAVAGRPPDASQLAAVLADLSDINLFPVLVAACTGDRVAMLLDLVEAVGGTSRNGRWMLSPSAPTHRPATEKATVKI